MVLLCQKTVTLEASVHTHRLCPSFCVCVCAQCTCARTHTGLVHEPTPPGHLNDLNVSLQVGSEYGLSDHSAPPSAARNLFISCSATISRSDLMPQFVLWRVGDTGERNSHDAKASPPYYWQFHNVIRIKIKQTLLS